MTERGLLVGGIIVCDMWRAGEKQELAFGGLGRQLHWQIFIMV